MDGLLSQTHQQRKEQQWKKTKDEHCKKHKQVAKQTRLILNNWKADWVAEGTFDLSGPISVILSWNYLLFLVEVKIIVFFLMLENIGGRRDFWVRDNRNIFKLTRYFFFFRDLCNC